MLVLSRRTRQEIMFPNLGITLQVLQVRGQIVKIGIEAPRSISIIRPEGHSSEPLDESEQGQLEHRLRNELNLLHLRLETLQRRLAAGEQIDAASTLAALLSGVDNFDRELAPEESRSRTTRQLKLFVVEDSDNERKLMAYMLASHGFEVHVARDGVEAIESLRGLQALPDVVLMDVQMPLANGLETLSLIRHDSRLSGLKVFAVTGSRRNPEEEPVGRGWDGWFSKPLDVPRLIESLQGEVAQRERVASNPAE